MYIYQRWQRTGENTTYVRGGGLSDQSHDLHDFPRSIQSPHFTPFAQSLVEPMLLDRITSSAMKADYGRV